MSATSVVIDGRDMQPPEPLEKTLAALDAMPRDGSVHLLVYCHPAPLINVLRRNGYAWEETVQPDGTHEIIIRHG